MKRQYQITPLELAIRDKRPVHQWVTAVEKLAAKVYEHDADLAQRLGRSIQRLSSNAADLSCIGTDDPTAPEPGAPTDQVTEYFFRRRPEDARELGRALARADQILGRREFLRIIGHGV